MTQYSLFGDDNFEEAPKKEKKVAAPKPAPKVAIDPEPIHEPEVKSGQIGIPESELKKEAVAEKVEFSASEVKMESAIIAEETPELRREAIAIPLGDIKAEYDLDEKSLEENYVREVFIFEEPAPDLGNEKESLAKEKVEEKEEKPKVVNTIKSKHTRGRLKLSDTHLAASSIEVPDDEILFSKRYYSIGVVANVNISLLRYWENEFTILKPRKNAKGDRHFRPEDIKNLQLIHHLLREKKYTLEGAKDFLKKTKNTDDPLAIIENLKDLKSFLLEIKTNL